MTTPEITNAHQAETPVLVGIGQNDDKAIFNFADGHTEAIAIADINAETLQRLTAIVNNQATDNEQEKAINRHGQVAENVQAQPSRASSRKGLTLTETLVSIAIMGVALSLLLPAVNAARQSARRISDQNNLRQVGMTLQNYASANNDKVPNNATPFEGSAGGFRESGLLALAPYMEGNTFVQNYDKNSWYFSPENEALMQNGGLSILKLSSFPGGSDVAGRTDVALIAGAEVIPTPYTDLSAWQTADWQQFVGNWNPPTVPNDRTGLFKTDTRASVFDQRKPVQGKFRDITDGTSNTIVIAPNGGSVAEDAHSSVQVTAINPAFARVTGNPDFISERGVKAPEDATLRGVGTRKDGTTTVVYADGHVENLNVKDMDKKAWTSRITINGGEVNDSMER